MKALSFRNSIVLLSAFIFLNSWSQILTPDTETSYYLIHSSGNVVCENSEERAVIEAHTGSEDQLLKFVPDGNGYYWVKPVGQNKYMALSGSWTTYFITDSTTNKSLYAIEKVSDSYVKLKCKSNSKYLGTDYTTSGSYIYSDKDGTDSKHYWYLSKEYEDAPADTQVYKIDPSKVFEKSFDGWGVSLCWWANMCGKWSDDKIDEIVEWLVSPEGLNYNIFRYNIGGGDDPLNRNCTPHHMADGKGLRAEMEGFKDSLDADYNWTRDSAQRKIMLKIKELRPNAVFEAFSNSPPYYMTYSGCCAGNTDASEDNLKPEYYDEFAHYLVDVCKFYKDSFDIEFWSLEPFNEPVTNYWEANGGQEGCHFSTTSQIAFLKILAPILEESGLNTIISASDETSAEQSVTDYLAYAEDDTALALIGQWNAHTYSADHPARANLRALSTYYDKPLWMSEVGMSGSGISGNLGLAQKLMNDIRYIRPEAWLDWQYIEEANDQWCTVQGDFDAQTYERVKNFYVRQQFSRYIPVGSRFIYVPQDNMLAAFSPSYDSLIIVALNNSSMEAIHKVDLSLFSSIGSVISATRTSDTEDNATLSDYTMTDTNLMFSLPAYSIATVTLSIGTSDIYEEELLTNTPYLILSRTASLMLQSSESSVIINSYIQGDKRQVWKLTETGDGYTLMNYMGKTITDNGTYYAESSIEDISGQTFEIENIGDDCYKIISTSTGKSLDLEGEANTAGTKVGLWAYGSTPAASHRQWLFLELPNADTAMDYSSIDDTPLANNDVTIFGSRGSVVILQSTESPSQLTVYSISGQQLVSKEINSTFMQVNIKQGIYIVRHISVNGEVTTKKVIVK